MAGGNIDQVQLRSPELLGSLAHIVWRVAQRISTGSGSVDTSVSYSFDSPAKKHPALGFSSVFPYSILCAPNLTKFAGEGKENRRRDTAGTASPSMWICRVALYIRLHVVTLG